MWSTHSLQWSTHSHLGSFQQLHVLGSLEHPRNKRSVGVLLGLAGFATAAAALGWDAYQQVEIARHADQLKAEGELNKDEEDTSVLLSDSIRTVAR